MLARRIIYIVIGWFLIVMNLLSNLVRYSKGELRFEMTPYGVGEIIGSHIFILLGIALLTQARKVKKKIILKREESFINNEINEIGKNY